MTPIPLTDPGRISIPQAENTPPRHGAVPGNPDTLAAFLAVLGRLPQPEAPGLAEASAATEAAANRDLAAPQSPAREDRDLDSADALDKTAVAGASPPTPVPVSPQPPEVPAPALSRLVSTAVTELTPDILPPVGLSAGIPVQPASWQRPVSTPDAPQPAQRATPDTLPPASSAGAPPASGRPPSGSGPAEAPAAGPRGIDHGGGVPSQGQVPTPAQPIVAGVTLTGASPTGLPAMVAVSVSPPPIDAAESNHIYATTPTRHLTGLQPGPDNDDGTPAKVTGTGATPEPAESGRHTTTAKPGSETSPPTERGGLGPVAAPPTRSVPESPSRAPPAATGDNGATGATPSGRHPAEVPAEGASADHDRKPETALPEQRARVITSARTNLPGIDIQGPDPGPPGAAEVTTDHGVGPEQAAAHPLSDRPQPLPSSALPAGFGQRLAETVASFPDRPVELTLSPEELGRVRMTLTTQDGTLTLAIQADRPETIDLMRRHIDQLAQDFRDLGFTNLNFSFGHGDSTAGNRQEQETTDQRSADRPENNGARAPRLLDRRAQSGAGGGLDLRL